LALEDQEKRSVENLTSGALSPVWERVRSMIPAGTEIFDAHAHIGVDVDGRTMTADGMRARMETAGVSRAIVFPLNDPNARDDYSGPNDVVWAAHEEHPGFYVPFFRLNPHLDYDREFERCVARGFEGIKLHPVSQRFELDDERVVRLFGIIERSGLPVLIHTGFAMQRVVEPLRGVVEKFPDLRIVLGHAAMVEVVEAVRAFGDNPNVMFETSVVRARDLYVLFSIMDPSRICYGSDVPYGDLPSTLHSALASAETAGVPQEAVPGIVSGNIRRWFP
jgi:predicted TIM-barrel fold metal-dependent hydrolase